MAVRIQVLGERKLGLDVFTPRLPAEDEIRVSLTHSAISQGSELLAYRAELEGIALNKDIDPLQGQGLGYAAVGAIAESRAEGLEVGQRVFCFTGHANQATLHRDLVIPIPDDISNERALFYANAETAVTLVWDAQPLAGEAVAIWGLGTVGALASSLLARFPLDSLHAFEPSALRRDLVSSLLRIPCRAPASADEGSLELDASIEVSGNEKALNAALAHARYSGRIIVGSWFGNKRVPLELGGHFHRRRLQLISSQVSTLAPALRGRFDRKRRSQVVWDLLRTHAFETWITHRWTMDEANEAYRVLEQDSASTMQTVFVHS